MAEYLIQGDTLTGIGNAIRGKTGKTGTLTPAAMATEIAGISTGVELNFKVVGGTSKPSSPTANTIWVNTSTTITSYVFSANQPTGASGKVWVKVGASSSVAFNVLKSNTVNVYPVSVMQYVSGAWKNKEAQIYQSSAWVTFSREAVYIYNGSTSTGYSFKCDTGMRQISSGYAGSADYVVKNTSNIKVTNGTANYSFTNMFVTDSSNAFTKISLANYSKIRIKGTLSGAGTDRAAVFKVLSALGDLATDNNTKSVKLTGSTVDMTVDVSSLTSSYYLGFTFYNETTGTATTFTLTQLWLE
jgi:hypothetical protein